MPMKKNCVQNIVIHIPENINFYSFYNKINEFHFDVIKSSLDNSDLTVDEKIIVIDKILKSLKAREFNGIIK